MSALANIQRDFCQFVRGHGYQDFLNHMKPSDLPKETTLDVYYHNVFSTHLRSLANDYPLVFSLMGEPAASTMAMAYIETSFPCTGSLEDWGAGFISFIQRYGPAVAWPYLSDVAQYEWAKHQAYCADEDPLLGPDDMAQLIAPDHELVFQFQKSCQLLAFSHPLEHIILACQQAKNELSPDISGSSYVLIFKHQGIIKIHWLTPSLFAFVNRLKEGQDMEVAYAAAQVLEPQFDVQAAFRFLLSHPILHR
jgi:hypothetical protein